MAGKKKKPAANPMRGFATTSIASKVRVEAVEADVKPQVQEKSVDSKSAAKHHGKNDTKSEEVNPAVPSKADSAPQLSPEEFEKQLEDSELQLLVAKHAQKVKRDAARQAQRLDTDRRLLRASAENTFSRKWLSQEIVEEVLALIQSEGRSLGPALSSDASNGAKILSEEDLTMRLWTLQQALHQSGFQDSQILPTLAHITENSNRISGISKDAIWGLDEALDWLAKSSNLEDLPDYDHRDKTNLRSQSETPADTPSASGTSTPLLQELETHKQKSSRGHRSKRGARALESSTQTKLHVTFDGELEPEELLPEYLQARTELLTRRLEQRYRRQGLKNQSTASPLCKSESDASDSELEMARLRAKLEFIEKDPLFDKYVAEVQWQPKAVAMEKDFFEARRAQADDQKVAKDGSKQQDSDQEVTVFTNETDDIAAAAAKMAEDILNEDSEEGDVQLSELFASLPTNEVDVTTGQTRTTIADKGGSTIAIRDFGKWTGMNPTRILEEACRLRDAHVRLSYVQVSDTAFASRHLLCVDWTKTQEALGKSSIGGLEVASSPNRYAFKMTAIATPDVPQSEAFIAVSALFLIFGQSVKDDKIALRLPTQWKDLWDEYADARKEALDNEDKNAIRALRSLVRDQRDLELEDGVLLKGAFRGRGVGRDGVKTPDIADASKRAPLNPEIYQEIWRRKSSTPKYQTMLQSRQQLPMWQFRNQVVEVVEREQVVIVCGETGCGKSTQVPSFLLEHQLAQGKPCKIYVTEPRRISAISLARRVSEELGENHGDIGTPRSLVGYSIRLEANTSKETRLVFATTGIVMRMLEGSNDLQDITHLVLDEVHERSIDSDFLLIVLKKLLERRKDLRVVLMSATVDAQRFSKYLGGAPVLNVPGRTFPVQVYYLEDAVEATGYSLDRGPREKYVDFDDDEVDPKQLDKMAKPDLVRSLKGYSANTRNTLNVLDEYQIDADLIVQLITQIAVQPEMQDYSKAILVFLPGIAEIRTLHDILLGDRMFANNWLVYPMHSTIASEEQEAAFLIPPPGYRKIVLATNIAETGITIPDVTCVIDTGKHREMRFDERRQLSKLVDTFISRANAKQRRGRAGRVQNGICFHLFTKLRHDTLLSDQQTPEMLRLSLQDLAIRVKICKIGGIEETLSEALDPPSSKNIRRAIDALIDVRALTTGEDLTPLGQQLARLPLDVFLGKLILLGTIFKCLDMAVTVAAILSSKSPFIAPFGQRNQADTVRLAFRRGDSDVLTVYNAYQAWKRVCQSTMGSGTGSEFQFCRKNFLSTQTLANIEDLKGQLFVQLVDSGFLQVTDAERRALRGMRSSGGSNQRRRHQTFFELPHRVNINSDNDVISQSVIAWSFYPKLLIRDVPGGKGLRNIGNNQSISLHPTSVNKGHNELRFLSYYHIMQSKGFLNAHETSVVEPFAVALLCGDIKADMYSGVLILDGNRARFALPDWKTMLVMKVLRTRLRELMTRAFRNPGKLPTPQHEKWLEIWQKIFSQDFGDKKSAAKA